MLVSDAAVRNVTSIEAHRVTLTPWYRLIRLFYMPNAPIYSREHVPPWNFIKSFCGFIGLDHIVESNETLMIHWRVTLKMALSGVAPVPLSVDARTLCLSENIKLEGYMYSIIPPEPLSVWTRIGMWCRYWCCCISKRSRQDTVESVSNCKNDIEDWW